MRMYAFYYSKVFFLFIQKATIKMHRNTQVRRTWLNGLIGNLIYSPTRIVTNTSKFTFLSIFGLFSVETVCCSSTIYELKSFLCLPMISSKNQIACFVRDSFKSDDEWLIKTCQNFCSLKINFHTRHFGFLPNSQNWSRVLSANKNHQHFAFWCAWKKLT